MPALLRRLLAGNAIDAIIHFAGSVVVPESVADPLGYYLNNTCKSRSLIASAVEAKVPHFIFSSTAAVYGMPKENPVAENARARADLALRHLEADDRDDAARHGEGASDLRYVALRYFNVAGADPLGPERPIDRARHASHQGRVRGGARRAALSRSVRHRLSDAGRHLHPRLYPCERSGRARISTRSRYLRAGGKSEVLNCGYGSGFSVLDVIGSVKRASQKRFHRADGPAPGRRSRRDRRQGRPDQQGAGLAASAQRPRHHRRPRAGLGKAADRVPRRLVTPRHFAFAPP